MSTITVRSLTLATCIAAVAVVTDFSILVVGAMVVGPEFAVVAAIALGLALRDLRLSARASLPWWPCWPWPGRRTR